MRTQRILTFCLLIVALSCSSLSEHKEPSSQADDQELVINEKIAEYVVNVYLDANDELWMGTLEKGLAHYDGEQLRYLTTADGLPSNRVVGITEDDKGNMWLGTGEGISIYNGSSFENIRLSDGMLSNSIGGLFFDSTDLLWIGTWGGVYQYDGKEFTLFELPTPEVDTLINPDTKDWITEIIEDSEGNIWISRDGCGAVKFDRKEFTHYTKRNGLLSNGVTEIAEDAEGNFWFGSRVSEHDLPDPDQRTGPGGVNKMNNDSIMSFPGIDGFNDGDVYEIYVDPDNQVWISTVKKGVYRFDGTEFHHYSVPVSVMSMIMDQSGNLWMGAAGGLYCITSEGEVVNVNQDGPWDF